MFTEHFAHLKSFRPLHVDIYIYIYIYILYIYRRNYFPFYHALNQLRSFNVYLCQQAPLKIGKL